MLVSELFSEEVAVPAGVCSWQAAVARGGCLAGTVDNDTKGVPWSGAEQPCKWR